jgi:SAM-dependent methyltransferase
MAYGRRWADIYDEFYDSFPDETHCIEILAALAGRGPVLELGIGTGRVALPLARRGVEVHGIEISPEMIARLRAKPGSERIVVYMGNFADVAVTNDYTLVFVIFNTLFHLTSQDEQVRCLVNVARHLSPNGALVVEAMIPGWGHSVQTYEVHSGGLTLYVPQRDNVTQRVVSQLLIIRGNGTVSLLPDVLRYAWPSELDLMARIAGLRLRERWGGWRREPFTASSTKHISVYEPAVSA